MITKEMLKTFCGLDRPHLKEPWTWGAWTYATDAAIVIRVPGLIDVQQLPVEHVSQAKVDKVFETDPSDGNFLPMPQPPPDGWGLVCTVCDGRKVCKKFCCPECGGISEVSAELVCTNCNGCGRLLDQFPVQFQRHLLNARLLQGLLILCNVQLAQNKSDKSEALSIRFDGGEGRLMPMRGDS